MVRGYVSGNGKELAIVGTRFGTSFVNATNAQNPIEVAFIPGAGSCGSGPRRRQAGKSWFYSDNPGRVL